MRLLDLIFPPQCAGCGGMGTAWCGACNSSVRAMPAVALDGTPLIAAGWLEGPLQRAIHTYKYGRRPGLATPLSQLLFEAADRSRLSLREITFVPLHPSRERERGFNQAERLARELAARLGVPLVAGLTRARPSPAQVGLGGAARRENMLGAFAWTSAGAAPSGLGLVDDVCTTGATLEAGAAAVGAAGGTVAAFLVVAAAQTLAAPVVTTPGTVCLS